MNYRGELRFNDERYFGSKLAKLIETKLSSQTTSGYKKSLYLFIKEWISPSEVIRVKTSGTTGKPKEITFRKSQAISSAKMTCEYFGLNKNTNTLLCLSTEYIGGKMMVVRAFVSGMNLITVGPSSNPLSGLNKRIDFASMVPLQVNNILQAEKTKNKFLSISNVIIGGAPVSPLLESMLTNCSNNVYSTFAMTETLSHVALKKLSGKDRTDYFETLPGITILTDDRECLAINAPVLSEDLIITNDVVEIINSTRFRWLGRYDNVINSGGIKIHPEMIEQKLAAFVKHIRFFITSLPDEKLGQKVVMVVECLQNFDINQIIDRAEITLSKYETPKEYYRTEIFLETFTGKIKKAETLKIATRF
jgi:O-succinylbenzoic acid--CoA ligase